MSRFIELELFLAQSLASSNYQPTITTPLPVVDWSAIGVKQPEPIDFDYQGPDAPLPAADWVIVTWTTSEWSALDHVFCNSDRERNPTDNYWQKDWKQYSKNAPEGDGKYPLWGTFRMVKIYTQSGDEKVVLLFKSEAHLQYSPWVTGLYQMGQQLLEDTGAANLYSVGTAGGVSENDFLGNSVVTNGGYLNMEKDENMNSDLGKELNGQTFTCKDWFPSFNLMSSAEAQLFFPLEQVANMDVYAKLYGQLCVNMEKQGQSMEGIELSDLINKPLIPKNLGDPKTNNDQGTPLYTADFYYIASPSDVGKYCILEMDDAVLGAAWLNGNAKFAFVRNVSDTFVPAVTANGQTITNTIRNAWSSLIYQTFGFYTSFNGAVSALVTIAAE